MKTLGETIIGNLPSLANVVLTYAGNLISENLDVLSLSAVTLTLIVLAAKGLRRKRTVPRYFQAHESFTRKRAGSLFKSQRTPVLKPCPSCAQRLPLSAIICDTCDYNFLAERPGRRQALLQPPRPAPFVNQSACSR